MKHKFRRVIALLLACIMSFSVLLVPAAAATFVDVPGGAWYSQAVDYVYEKGWMRGVSDTQFAPGQELTRGMFVTVLARIAGAEQDDGRAAFSDTPAGKWFTGAAAWAAEKGVVNGVGGGKFAPYLNISRQDLCTMIYRYLKAEALDARLPAEQDTSFVDAAYVSGYAKDAVEFCAAVGLIAGFSEKDGTLTFRPGATATRAQTAVILMRLDRLLNGEAEKPEPMPAQSFSEDCGEGVRVSVNAPEGALPEGTKMQATPLTDERIVADFKAVVGSEVLAVTDISFLRDGKELEPKAEVEVQMSVPGLAEAENPRVYHIRTDGKPELVESEMLSLTRSVGDRVLRFNAKDFSVYVVTEEAAASNTLTVEFYDWDGALINAQNVRQDRITNPEITELVYDPGVPSFGDDAKDKAFEGWYEADDRPGYAELNAATGVSITDINAEIKETYATMSGNLTIKFYPLIFYVAKLNYYDQQGALFATQTQRLLYDTATGQPSTSTTITVDKVYTPASESQHFDGTWVNFTEDTVTPGIEPEYHTNATGYESYTNGTSTVTVSKDAPVKLFPHLQTGYWLYFDNNIEKNGIRLDFPEDDTPAKLLVPVYVEAGQEITAAWLNSRVTPNRQGYVFDGWYLDARTNSKAFPTDGASLTVNSDMTFYAKWEFGESYYSETFWRQYPDDEVDLSEDEKHYALESDPIVVTQNTQTGRHVKTGDNVEMTDEESGVNKYGVYHTGMCSTNTDDDFYFTISPKSVLSGRVRGDGTTTLVRKLNRKVITFVYLDQEMLRDSSNYVSNPNSSYYNLDGLYATNVYGTTANNPSADLSFPQVSNYSGITDGSSVPVGKLANYSAYSHPAYYFVVPSDAVRQRGLYGHQWILPKKYQTVQLNIWARTYGWGAVMYYPDPYEVFDVVGGDQNGIPRDRTTLYLWATPAGSAMTVREYKMGTDGQYHFTPDLVRDVEMSTTGVEYNEVAGSPFSLYGAHAAVQKDSQGHDIFSDSADPSRVNLKPSSTKGVTVHDHYSVYFIRRQYTLRYIIDTGVEPVSNQYYYEEEIPEEVMNYKPPVPTSRIGYYFDGWYTDATFQTEATVPETMPAHNLELYAKWTPVYYRVCMDFSAGLTDAEKAQLGFVDRSRSSSWLLGQGQLAPEGRFDAVWPGHYIVGWYSDPEFQHRYDFSTTMSENVRDMDMEYGVQKSDESDETYYARMRDYSRVWKDQISGANGDDRWWYGDPSSASSVLRTDHLDAKNVRGRLILYAKWAELPENSTGLRVRYLADHSDSEQGRFEYIDVNPEDIYDDPQIYVDGTEAFAQPASTPVDSARLYFRLWELLDKDGETTNITIAPGQTFLLNMDYAARKLVSYISGYTPWSPVHTHDASPVHYTDAAAPSCTAAGHPANSWYCAGCGCYFADSACTTPIEGNYEALGHDWKLPEGVCSGPGLVTWTCAICGATKNSVLPYQVHANLVTHNEERPADCQAPALQAGWQECTVCGMLFGDKVPGSEPAPHNFNTPELTWSGLPESPVDWDAYPTSGVTCTAAATCTVCGTELRETVEANCAETTSPIGHDGAVTYTATFTKSPFDELPVADRQQVITINERPAYVITYHAHNGTYTDSCTIGTSYTVNRDPGNPSLEDGATYTFLYWVDGAAYAENANEPGAKVTNGTVLTPDGDKDYYAVYRKVETKSNPKTLENCFVPTTTLTSGNVYVISSTNTASGKMINGSSSGGISYNDISSYRDTSYADSGYPVLLRDVPPANQITLSGKKLRLNCDYYLYVWSTPVTPNPSGMDLNFAALSNGTVDVYFNATHHMYWNSTQFGVRNSAPSTGAYVWEKQSITVSVVESVTTYLTITSSNPNIVAGPSDADQAELSRTAAAPLLRLRMATGSSYNPTQRYNKLNRNGQNALPKAASPEPVRNQTVADPASGSVYELADSLTDGASYLLVVGNDKLMTDNCYYGSFAPALENVVVNSEDQIIGNYTTYELVAHRNSSDPSLWRLSNEAAGDLSLDHTVSHALKFGRADNWWSYSGNHLLNSCGSAEYQALIALAGGNAASVGAAGEAATVRFYRLAEGTHTVTVNYQSADGTTLRESYVGAYGNGDPYSLVSPTISGYKARQNLVQGEINGANVTATVIYDQIDVDALPDYEDGWWELEEGAPQAGEEYLMVLQSQQNGLIAMVQTSRAYSGVDDQLENYRQYTLLGQMVRGGWLACPYPLCLANNARSGNFSAEDSSCVISAFDQLGEFDRVEYDPEDYIEQRDFESCIVTVQPDASTPNGYRIASKHNPNYLFTWDYYGAYFDNNGGDVWVYDTDTHFLTTQSYPEGQIGLRIGWIEEDDNGNNVIEDDEIDCCYHLYNCNESALDTMGAKVYFFKRHKNDPEQELSVTFKDADGTVIDRKNVFDGTSLSTILPAAPDKDGYRFDGWVDDNGNLVNSASTTVTSPMTLTASYTACAEESYVITLRALYAPRSLDGTTSINWYANNETDKNGGAGACMVDLGVEPGASAVPIPMPGGSGGESFQPWDEAGSTRVFLESDGETATVNGEVGLVFPGHRFLGWARVPSSGSGTGSGAHPELNSVDDCYLIWDAANNRFVYNTGGQVPANYVTSDALDPYYDMYAVWESVFYVFHSSTGELVAYNVDEAKKADGTFDLVDHVEPGYLYGGHYDAYGYISTEEMNRITGTYSALSGIGANWNTDVSGTADPGRTAVTTLYAGSADDTTGKRSYVNTNFETYDGHCRYTNGSNKGYARDPETNSFILYPQIWDRKAHAVTTVRGDAVCPSAGDVFYIKEVPSYYLTTRFYYVYDSKDNNDMVDLWMISVVDDSNYRDVGFYYGYDDNFDQIFETGYLGKDVLAGAFTMKAYDGPTLTVRPESFFDEGMGCALNTGAGLLAIKHNQTALAGLKNEDDALTVFSSWITPDGVRVTNNTTRWTVNHENDAEAEGKFINERGFNGEEKLYFNLNVTAKGTTWAIQSGETVYQQYAFFSDGENTELAVLNPVPGKDGLYSCTVPAGFWKKVTLKNFNPEQTVNLSAASNQSSGECSLTRFANKLVSFDPTGTSTDCSWGFVSPLQTIKP